MSELGPGFDAKAGEVCGLYLDPPKNAIVVSIDEKTSIAAREPARPDTLPAPRRPARREGEYLRHGTINLFAALRVHSGELAGIASWLNQVEIFFSILTRRLLRHGQFSDPEDLATQMLAFVEHDNLTAKPFAWTYTGKVLAA